jgi:hypothetical protein
VFSIYEKLIILNKRYFKPAAQHCFAADAAGAAPDLGAIFCGRGVLPAVLWCMEDASSAAESWRWAATTVVPVAIEIILTITWSVPVTSQ